MSDKEDQNKIRNKSKAEEPETAYNTIRFFNSVEEMNKYDYQQYSKMTPEERLNAVCEMRDAYWPDEKENKPFGSNIYFKE